MMERMKTMAILALLAALAGSIALAATDGEVEVRITARQLADGRVEFALQQRVEGEWSDRILPRSRFFPVHVGHNLWLYSAPLTVSASVAGDLSEEPTTSVASQTSSEDESVEVRITARQLEDERVEFALQQRVDGEWGGRILPPSRFFPADAAINRWLNSTPMIVSVAGAGDLTEEPTTSARPRTPAIRTQVGEGVTPVGAVWSVQLDDFTDERLAFVASPTESSSSIYEPRLTFGCGKNGTVLLAMLVDLPVSDINDRYTVTIRWDSLAARTFSTYEHGNRAYLVDNPALYRRNVINHDMLRVRFKGYSDSVTATIDVSAMRNAPTWPNILACGN